MHSFTAAGAGGRHQGGRGRRGDDHLVGTYVKIRLGPFKGYSGRLVEVKDKLVRVELEAKIVTGKLHCNFTSIHSWLLNVE